MLEAGGGTVVAGRRTDEPLQAADFDDFARRERAGLLALAFALSADRHAAEDLVQDALLEAFRRWDQISRYDDPAAWARRVVVTRATSRWRKLRTESRALERMKGAVDLTAPPAEVQNERFWAEVRALAPRQAEVIVLRYVADLEVAEIARTLETAEGTIKATLHQARRAIATRMNLEVDDA